MVHFGDDGEVSSSSKVQNNEKVLSLLVTHIEEGTDIAERIRLMQQTVLSSEAYAGISYFLCSLLMPFWMSLCVLRRTCR
jgi:hypothetical protein